MEKTMNDYVVKRLRSREYKYNSKPNLHPEAYLQRGLKKQGKTDNTNVSFHGNNIVSLDKVNKRDVWVVPTKPSQEAHFAVFPEELIIDCVKAGCPENGIVLDPFMGSNTTAIVAKSLGRNYIGYEINGLIDLAKQKK